MLDVILNESNQIRTKIDDKLVHRREGPASMPIYLPSIRTSWKEFTVVKSRHI